MMGAQDMGAVDLLSWANDYAGRARLYRKLCDLSTKRRTKKRIVTSNSNAKPETNISVKETKFSLVTNVERSIVTLD